MRWLGLLLCMGCGRLDFDARPLDGGAPDASVDSGRAWWDPAWSHRIKLVIEHTGAAALTDFPLLVKLDPTRVDYADAHVTGNDLRFIANDQELPFDIEKFGETDSFVWVRLPTLTTGLSNLYLYYGNANAAPAASSNLTWAGYSAVYHLSDIPQGTANDIADSTANNNKGSSQGGMSFTSQNTGALAGSILFDGTDDLITAPSSASLTLLGDLTVQLWVNVLTERDQWLLDYVEPVTEQESGNHLYEVAINGLNRPELQWEYGAGNDEGDDSTTAIAAPSGFWTQLTYVRNVNTKTIRYYENGALLGTPRTFANDPTGGTTSFFHLGGEPDGTSSKLPLAGRLDEVRLFPVERTPEWIAADYRSMTDQLITYGAPESF